MIELQPTIGILAYGSLIDEPGGELAPLIVRKIPDQTTPFPVEFARQSRTRAGAPTLVPYDVGAKVRAAILVLNTTADEATNMLWRRETREKDLTKKYPGEQPDRPGAVQVKQFGNMSGVDCVIYTSIAANIIPLTPARLAELAIASVAKARPGLDGISYLIAAKKNRITTALSPEYEAEILQITGADTLESALASVRDSG